MHRPMTPPRTHPAEPKPGSFRATTGEDADLFNLELYTNIGLAPLSCW